MKFNVILSIICLMFCIVSASCRSSAGDAGAGIVPEFLEIEGCSLPEDCMLVTPETLDSLPEPVFAEAKKHCGKPGVVVVVSSLRPRYLRLIRGQGRLLLGSVEIKSSRQVVYLCVMSGLGEAADSILSVEIENPDETLPWNLGIFISRYPELASSLGELPPGDERLNLAEPAARELLRRGSTRTMLEKHARGKDPAALEEAVQAEKEQIRVLEEILSSE